MANTPFKDLNGFLRSVGDPFQFSLPDGLTTVTADYQPMVAAVTLIEFASLDLWRSHLRHLNFTSCEEFLSTREGRGTALRCMFDTVASTWSEFLCTPVKIITAIRHLEELQCLNTAEVVILWAWTVGVVNPVDYDDWRSIECETLNFYRTHGIERLTALLQHAPDTTAGVSHMKFLLMRYRGPPCRVGSVRRPVQVMEGLRDFGTRDYVDLHISWVCQLRRLYHLFGYDPVTWREIANVREEGEAKNALGQSVAPVQFVDWACDYP